MANEKPKEPQVESAAASITPHEVLSQTAMHILARATPADLIGPDPNEEHVKASANESGCWIHSPAMVQLFAVTDRRLTRLANLMGMNVQEVQRVYVRLINGSKLIVIKPAPSTDRSAYPVLRYEGQSTTYINIASLLGPKKLTVKPGWRHRYDITYIPEGFQIGPGLVFDLSNPLERRQVTKKEEEEATNPGAAPAEAKKTKRTRSAKAKAQAAAQPTEPQAQVDPTKKDEGPGQE